MIDLMLWKLFCTLLLIRRSLSCFVSILQTTKLTETKKMSGISCRRADLYLRLIRNTLLNPCVWSFHLNMSSEHSLMPHYTDFFLSKILSICFYLIFVGCIITLKVEKKSARVYFGLITSQPRPRV